MTFSLSDRLLQRELADPYHFRPRRKRWDKDGIPSKPLSYSSNRGIYGDRAWVHGLDIVNELGGHTGCVNALSWSRSGRLLASGSDDTHLNIHAYQPDKSTKPFVLATTISTGHSANIFSVKFMPHSNDGTLISCAGDGQVRVFDIENNGRPASNAHISPSSTRHHSGVNLEELYRGVSYLSPATTGARVYRSHSDRVKRIITESSPHLFLTCSEDGEVRQWDLRLPSSAYPAPRRGQHLPPPLISYKKFQIDLNTISCSGSQPHYIVLGGSHLHAFLHDRRMLGRDREAERGSSSSRPASASGGGGGGGGSGDDELMGQATRCVRRFAPNGKARMTRRDGGHITACKISDSNPNEMIGSWSGDHIYAFDLVASPDALDIDQSESNVKTDGSANRKGRSSTERKRKREPNPTQQTASSPTTAAPLESSSSSSSSSSRRNIEHQGRQGAATRGIVGRRGSSSPGGDVALRVRYGNGQSEDIPLDSAGGTFDQVTESLLTDSQKRCLKIARSVARIRELLFSTHVEYHTTSTVTAPVRQRLDSAMSRINAVLPEMREISSSWGYPMSPSPGTIIRQRVMRSDRSLACHFLQASGVLVRLLGGTVHTVDPVQTSILMQDYRILSLPPELASPWRRFCFTLLSSVIAFLNDQVPGLLELFRNATSRSLTGRLVQPHDGLVLQPDAGPSAIQEVVIPHLEHLAASSDEQRAIYDVEANRFELDETRVLFSRGTDAVAAFARAIETILRDDTSRGGAEAAQKSAQASAGDGTASEDEKLKARRFLSNKLARGLLLSAGEDIKPTFINRAFGGPTMRTEPSEGRSQEDVDVDEPEEIVEELRVIRSGNDPLEEAGRDRSRSPSSEEEEDVEADDLHAVLRNHGITVTMSESEGEEEMMDDGLEFSIDETEDEDEAMLNDDDDDDDNDEDEDGGDDLDDLDDLDDDDDQGGFDEGEESEDEMDPRTLFSTAGAYGRRKENVEADVPCSSHTRTYVGHCNVRTVKDVNYYGLEDEYVVSGSDSGHMFIWDRKTGKLLNVLQGDGEVVNVIQGHPFEPMLAVSGIDHTIKIFSSDLRAQYNARHGVDLGASTRRHMRSRIRRANLDPPHSGRASRSVSGHRTPNTADPTADAAAATTAWGSQRGHDQEDDEDDDDGNIDDEAPTNGGLESCKRIKDSYEIMSQNDAERQGGMQDAFMTRSFLAQLAAHIYARRAAAAGTGAGGAVPVAGGGGTGGGPLVTIDTGEDGDDGAGAQFSGDDCVIM